MIADRIFHHLLPTFITIDYKFTEFFRKGRNGGMAEWRNGGMAEWRNGGMVESAGWHNGRMAEWRDGRMGGMAELRNGGMAEWWNGGTFSLRFVATHIVETTKTHQNQQRNTKASAAPYQFNHQ